MRISRTTIFSSTCFGDSELRLGVTILSATLNTHSVPAWSCPKAQLVDLRTCIRQGFIAPDLPLEGLVLRWVRENLNISIRRNPKIGLIGWLFWSSNKIFYFDFLPSWQSLSCYSIPVFLPLLLLLHLLLQCLCCSELLRLLLHLVLVDGHRLSSQIALPLTAHLLLDSYLPTNLRWTPFVEGFKKLSKQLIFLSVPNSGFQLFTQHACKSNCLLLLPLVYWIVDKLFIFLIHGE